MRLITVFTALLVASFVRAETIDFWPGAVYDPSVPTIKDVTGHEPGERITWHADVVRYFDALAKAYPDRVAVHRYAESWEGRELIYAVITSAENMSRIADIKTGMQQLRNAGSTGAQAAERIIESQPAVTWLSYGVHGNEISSTDAAMLTAYHLLAARNDERVDEILQNTVVIIDPMQNPDGRDRFIHHFEMAEGLLPDPDRISAEHDEPWPGGRTNHYLFDLNRDWFIMSQPETQGRIVATQEWYPVAFVDAHEMGSDNTYYFAPEAIPYNPHLAADQRASLELFGRTNARWFDRFGIDYFTREIYDAFYPGYGASWPSYFGSIAMTYEQASARGLVWRQYHGNEMTYASTVRNHFVTSLGTAETVASNREKFLREFYEYQLSAIDEGATGDIRAYVLPTQDDQAGANKLAGLLVKQGVEVGVATERFRACGESYEPGSYVINLAQPAKRLVRTLLDTDVPMDAEFMAEQERRRAKDMGDQIYDVTAWSMPLMMNIRADTCNRAVTAATRPAAGDLVLPGTVSGGNARVAYLVPWGEATAVRFLANALRAGIEVKSTDLAFTHEGQRYPSGTLIIDVADNDPSLHESVRALAASTGANVVAVNDSWVTDGPNFGSNNVVVHNTPRIAMAWDEPTWAYTAGNMRFVIERMFDYPVTAIRSDRLGTADLDRYQVLILPSQGFGEYAATLGEEGVQNLKGWVANGGVLIGIGTANRFLADPRVDLISIRREDAVVEGDDDNGGGQKSSGDEEDPVPTVEGSYLASTDDYESAITPESQSPDVQDGVIARADVDPDHWLGAGVASTINVVYAGTDIYTPIKLDAGVNVARYQSADALLASGYMWEENRKQLAYKPFAAVQASGAGFVIAFTSDPTIRAYQTGLNVIFMNAIFRGSAHARPVR
ncbi:MAG: peptidase [Woeseiaceae bacterium]|nr:peptidase [Woeseiaceae bacterium]NIP20803.1 peptidase [Woeseiaceae bacterium]NIS89596.1 peptidase [Woeseiaceae bacterium]